MPTTLLIKDEFFSGNGKDGEACKRKSSQGFKNNGILFDTTAIGDILSQLIRNQGLRLKI